MICEKCSVENLEGSVFCYGCGERLIPISEVEIEPLEITPIYTDVIVETIPYAKENTESSQNNTDNGQIKIPPTYTPNTTKDNGPVSMGKWLGMLCLNFIPIAGPIIFLVFQFIWAFDKERDETSRNWAKAHLIYTAISCVLAVIVGILIAVFTIAFNTSAVSWR